MGVSSWGWAVWRMASKPPTPRLHHLSGSASSGSSVDSPFLSPSSTDSYEAFGGEDRGLEGESRRVRLEAHAGSSIVGVDADLVTCRSDLKGALDHGCV